MLSTTHRYPPHPPPTRDLCLGRMRWARGGLSTLSLSPSNFPNFRFSNNAPKNFIDNYSVTFDPKNLEFVKGDLVYFVGYEGPADSTRLGIVYDIRIRHSHFPLYEIYWFKDKLQSTHTAAHIDLVYTENMIDDEVNPKSLHHAKDRVYDRGEGD